MFLTDSESDLKMYLNVKLPFENTKTFVQYLAVNISFEGSPPLITHVEVPISVKRYTFT